MTGNPHKKDSEVVAENIFEAPSSEHPHETMRLQKYMAHAGVASRRSSEQMILEGRVMVNGVNVTELGTSVIPGVDYVEVDGHNITLLEGHVYVMLNKPVGYITSVKDNFGRPTALDLVSLNRRLYPVGRLDYDSEGLILLTDDGTLTHLLTHPRHEFEKCYLVETAPVLSESALDHLRGGVDLGNGYTQPARVERQTAPEKLLIGIKEGKNRQIRRMIEVVGGIVVRLCRLSIGPLQMGDLKVGKWRYLTAQEIEALKALK